MKKQIIILAGPTTSGKTALASHLIQRYPLEIISADSRQVYEGLDIGTGKDMSVPQRMIDVAVPGQSYTVTAYQEQAEKEIAAVQQLGKTPLVVGGTGFYIEALIYRSTFGPASDPEIRKALEGLTDAELLHELRQADSDRAQTIDTKNRQRLLRAVEIIRITGKPIKEQERVVRPEQLLWMVLDVEREELYRKIDTRVDERLQHGMVEEVQKMIANGVSAAWLHSLGLEYRFISEYLDGTYTLQEMTEKLKFAIHAYVRRQETYFKRWKEAEWVKPENVEQRVQEFLVQP